MLGQLLFLLYIANVHDYITQSTVRSVADDTQVYKHFQPSNYKLAITILMKILK